MCDQCATQDVKIETIVSLLDGKGLRIKCGTPRLAFTFLDLDAAGLSDLYREVMAEWIKTAISGAPIDVSFANYGSLADLARNSDIFELRGKLPEDRHEREHEMAERARIARWVAADVNAATVHEYEYTWLGATLDTSRGAPRISKQLAKIAKARGVEIGPIGLSALGKTADALGLAQKRYFGLLVGGEGELIDYNNECGLFGDDSSCYWGCYSESRTEYLPALGGYSLMVVPETGTNGGRAWALPHDNCRGLLFFNRYGCLASDRIFQTAAKLAADRLFGCDTTRHVWNYTGYFPFYQNTDTMPSWIAEGDTPRKYVLTADCDDESETCEHCGDRIRNGDVYYVEGFGAYCVYCHDRLFSYCESCERDCLCDEFVLVHDRRGHETYVCESCAEDYSQCDECAGFFATLAEVEVHDNSGCETQSLCPDCLERMMDDHIECETCNEWFHVDMMEFTGDIRDCEIVGTYWRAGTGFVNGAGLVAAIGQTWSGEMVCCHCATNEQRAEILEREERNDRLTMPMFDADLAVIPVD